MLVSGLITPDEHAHVGIRLVDDVDRFLVSGISCGSVPGRRRPGFHLDPGRPGPACAPDGIGAVKGEHQDFITAAGLVRGEPEPADDAGGDISAQSKRIVDETAGGRRRIERGPVPDREFRVRRATVRIHDHGTIILVFVGNLEVAERVAHPSCLQRRGPAERIAPSVGVSVPHVDEQISGAVDGTEYGLVARARETHDEIHRRGIVRHLLCARLLGEPGVVDRIPQSIVDIPVSRSGRREARAFGVHHHRAFAVGRPRDRRLDDAGRAAAHPGRFHQALGLRHRAAEYVGRRGAACQAAGYAGECVCRFAGVIHLFGVDPDSPMRCKARGARDIDGGRARGERIVDSCHGRCQGGLGRGGELRLAHACRDIIYAATVACRAWTELESGVFDPGRRGEICLLRLRMSRARADIGRDHVAQGGNRHGDDHQHQYRHDQQETARALDVQLGLSQQKLLELAQHTLRLLRIDFLLLAGRSAPASRPNAGRAGTSGHEHLLAHRSVHGRPVPIHEPL